jgi:rhodanese-related sulfurtransferase
MSYQDLHPSQIDEFRKNDNHIILDVRSPQELSEGSIPGYKMINLFESSFISEIEKLDKSMSYLLYCRSGMRSAQACTMMGNMGFKNLYNLQGGIGAWKATMAHV